jgi:hypothetical protein
MSQEHRGLCTAEKDEVDERGRAMTASANDLYNGCIHSQLHYTNYGSDFEEAQMKLEEVYKQLTLEEYYDSLGLKNYDEGLKALAEGRTHMFNVFGRGEIDEVTYNDLFKKIVPNCV